MTDDEIDAVLIPVLSPHWDCDRDLTVTDCERRAYRAGMMMAAEIATEREKILWDERHQANVSNPDGTYGEGLSYGAQEAADFIHRAASE